MIEKEEKAEEENGEMIRGGGKELDPKQVWKDEKNYPENHRETSKIYQEVDEEISTEDDSIVEKFDDQVKRENKQKRNEQDEIEGKKYRNRSKRGDKLNKNSKEQLYRNKRKSAEKAKEDKIAA